MVYIDDAISRYRTRSLTLFCNSGKNFISPGNDLAVSLNLRGRILRSRSLFSRRANQNRGRGKENELSKHRSKGKQQKERAGQIVRRLHRQTRLYETRVRERGREIDLCLWRIVFIIIHQLLDRDRVNSFPFYEIQGAARYPLGPATSSRTERKKRETGMERKIERKRVSPRPASKLLTSRATGQPFGRFFAFGNSLEFNIALASRDSRPAGVHTAVNDTIDRESGTRTRPEAEEEGRTRTKEVSLLRRGRRFPLNSMKKKKKR